jgi:hypothetical protein
MRLYRRTAIVYTSAVENAQDIALIDTKSAQINLRLRPDLKSAAEQAAARDHRSLASLIEKLLSEYLHEQPTLADWHARARTAFMMMLVEKNLVEPVAAGTVTRSYCIRTTDGERIAPHNLTRVLGEAQAEVARKMNGPRLFYPYTRPELAPYFTSDRDLLVQGKPEEILQTVLLPGTASITDFWRVSPRGLATDVEQFFEDQDGFAKRGLEPGKWFSPFFMTRSLMELVFHAEVLARRFPSAEALEFRCEWDGLREREIADPDPMVHWLPGHIAQTDEIVTVAECAVSAVAEYWSRLVATLGGPTMRLFDPTFDYSPTWIEGQVPRMKR